MALKINKITLIPTLCLTGSQCSDTRTSVMLCLFLVAVRSLAAAFCISSRRDKEDWPRPMYSDLQKSCLEEINADLHVVERNRMDLPENSNLITQS